MTTTSSRRWRAAAAAALAVTVAASPIVAALLAGDSVDDWIALYVAGGFGGLVFEMLGSGWRLELPRFVAASSASTGGSASAAGDEDTGAGLTDGATLDPGFLGRLFAGGLSGVVVVVLVTAALAGDEGAATVAATPDADLSLGWALAAGASTRAVWSAVTGLVERRLAPARQALDDTATGIEVVQDLARSAPLDGQLAGGGPGDGGRGGALEGALAVIAAQLEGQRRSLEPAN